MAPSLKRQKRIIRKAALSQGLKPKVLWGLYGAETDFGRLAGATSSAGAQGPFQFMPDTAAGLGIDPHNFKQAAFGAAKYLAQYKGRGTAGMLAAYNAGPGGNPNNPETAAYIPKVLDLAKTWRAPQGGGGGGQLRDGARNSRQRATQGREVTTDVGSQSTLLPLLQQIGQRPQVAAGGLQAPAVSASAVTAQGSTQIAASGGPAPADQQDIASLIASSKEAEASYKEASRNAQELEGDSPSGSTRGGVAAVAGAAAAVDFARGKVGIAETGNNSGPFISKLESRFGMSNEAWCAMFTSAAVRQGGAPKSARTPLVSEVRRKAAASAEGYKGFVKRGKERPGDLILFGNDHIGMVERVTKNGYIMIAGNDSNKVNRRPVPFGAGDIVRPDYKGRR